MNGSKPYSPSGEQRPSTPSPERRTGPACSTFPSPRPSPAGRGRKVPRAVKDQARLIFRSRFESGSLSHRELIFTHKFYCWTPYGYSSQKRFSRRR